MPEQGVVNEVVGEIEHRDSLRRASDRWMIGIISALILGIFAGGMAWGTARAEISGKVDKDAFNAFVSRYEKTRATDSLSNTFRDTLVAKIDRKLTRVLCRTTPSECGL